METVVATYRDNQHLLFMSDFEKFDKLGLLSNQNVFKER